VVAVLELHTFSSLTKDFLPLYHQSMDAADRAFVHFNTHVFELKRMEVLSDDVVQKEFGNVEVETDVDKLWTRLQHEKRGNTVFLMMSSGSFAGKDIQSLV
jgi:UDP-N-acetylmuramate: L-alanyl-gamma-D-glutamyl-meso-diaminopimelate ligase